MDDYIQQLLREQGIPDNLDPEIRTEFVKELTSRATEFLNTRLLEAMPDDVAERFVTLLEGDGVNEAAVQEFVTNNIPDRDRVIETALADFRQLYLGSKA